MENCFWAELEDSSLMVPSSWLSPSDALQYHCYNPAAVVPPWVAPPFEGSPEDRAATASRSHSEAEKRRRDRINAQLATLRKLIPMSEKMDKAVLLGHAVEQIKEQSKRAKEVSKVSTIPTETDQVTIIDHSNTDKESHIIQMKATICCDDRPELLSEINGAIKGLGLTVMEAEITSLGGRVNSSFVVRANGKNVCIASLKQSIKLALGRVVLSSGESSFCVRSKRQRFFYPNNSY
ncbi:hypothetical protein ACP275_06G066600 [Erythranthe tilingii]